MDPSRPGLGGRRQRPVRERHRDLLAPRDGTHRGAFAPPTDAGTDRDRRVNARLISRAQQPWQAGSVTALQASRGVDGRAAAARDVLLQGLGAVLPADRAEEALARALRSERLPGLPVDPAALRFFVTGALRRVVTAMGVDDFESWAVPLARRVAEQVRPPGAPLHPVRSRVRRVIFVSIEPGLCARFDDPESGVTVSRAESIFDLSPLLELGPEQRGAVVVDAALSPLSLPALAQMAHILPPTCPVVVVGLSETAWGRLVSVLPTAAEWRRVPDFERIDVYGLVA